MGNILLAHESRTVRATLKTYLKPEHRVQEASDSDSAWHMLVLHNDLSAVIAGTDLGMATGMSLLERTRHNTLLRLKNMPFYFVASETRIAELTEEATRAGANGFLHNGMKRQEVLEILEPAIGSPTISVLTSGNAAPPPEPIAKPVVNPVSIASSTPTAPESIPALEFAAEPKQSSVKRTLKTGLIEAAPMSPHLFEEAVVRQYSLPGQRGAIICCAIGDYPDLVKKLGENTASSITQKLVKLAQTRIGRSDIISLYAPGVFIISALNSNLATCAQFTSKLKNNLAAAKIQVHGKPQPILLVPAYAAIPEDGQMSGKELLNLVKHRLVEILHTAKAK